MKRRQLFKTAAAVAVTPFVTESLDTMGDLREKAQEAIAEAVGVRKEVLFGQMALETGWGVSGPGIPNGTVITFLGRDYEKVFGPGNLTISRPVRS